MIDTRNTGPRYLVDWCWQPAYHPKGRKGPTRTDVVQLPANAPGLTADIADVIARNVFTASARENVFVISVLVIPNTVLS